MVDIHVCVVDHTEVEHKPQWKAYPRLAVPQSFNLHTQGNNTTTNSSTRPKDTPLPASQTPLHVQWNLFKMVTVFGSHFSKAASLPGPKEY